MANASGVSDPSPPHVELGDEVYCRTPRGPAAGRVLARGAHGVTVEIDGKRTQVRWEDIHGLKTRVRPDCKVVDQGEDGVIVEEPGGRRRFLHDPGPAEEPVAKSLMPAVLLFGAAGSLAKAIAPTKPQPRVRVAAPAKHPFGPGDEVRFGAAEKEMTGKIVGEPGDRGAYVEAEDGRLHQVLWSSMRAPEDRKDAAVQAGG